MPGGLPVASIRTPSDSCSSSIPTLCMTPLQGTTSSLEAGGDPGGGVDREVAAEPRDGDRGRCGAAAAGSGSRPRRRRPAAPRSAPRCRRPLRASTPPARPCLAQHPLHPQPGDDPRPRLAGLRQGVEVDAALGVVGAADRALAGAATARRVAAQRGALPVERRGALEREFAVSPQHLHRRGGDADRRFDVGDPRAEQLEVGEGEAVLACARRWRPQPGARSRCPS